MPLVGTVGTQQEKKNPKKTPQRNLLQKFQTIQFGFFSQSSKTDSPQDHFGYLLQKKVLKGFLSGLVSKHIRRITLGTSLWAHHCGHIRRITLQTHSGLDRNMAESRDCAIRGIVCIHLEAKRVGVFIVINRWSQGKRCPEILNRSCFSSSLSQALTQAQQSQLNKPAARIFNKHPMGLTVLICFTMYLCTVFWGHSLLKPPKELGWEHSVKMKMVSQSIAWLQS